MDLTQHLFLIRLIFLSDPFTAMTVQFISAGNCFHTGIMKFQYLINRWVYVVSIYRCCMGKIWGGIMRANGEGGEV